MSTGRNAPRGVTKRAIAALMFWKKDSSADGVADSADIASATSASSGQAEAAAVTAAPADTAAAADAPVTEPTSSAAESAPADEPTALADKPTTSADEPVAPVAEQASPAAAEAPETTAEHADAAAAAPSSAPIAATGAEATHAAPADGARTEVAPTNSDENATADGVASTNGSVGVAERTGEAPDADAPSTPAATATEAGTAPSDTTAPATAATPPAEQVDPTQPSAVESAAPAPAKKTAPRKKAAAKTVDPSTPAKKTAARKTTAAKAAAVQDVVTAPEATDPAAAPSEPVPAKSASKAPAKKTAAAKSTTPRKTARKAAAPQVEERPLTPRRLADSTYRDEQFAARYEGSIAPFNHLVDRLTEESGEPLPYLAPVYGGTEARVLSLFRDPGPRTRSGQQSSGLLSLENDDQAAERYLEFFQTSGLRIGDLITWNAYPWYTTRKPSTADIDRGIAPLEQVIALLPKLKVVLAHGLDAQAAWRRFERQHPEVASKLIVIPTYHTSKQALFTQDEAVRAQREDKLRSDFAKAAEHLVE
ncbi:uracil-DNA glycosylase [Nocardia jiangsuensis]|uniref:Uracil-DNA glycosylase n=1 Tax=Nocardia jiangsuensis TaxID=1691563 RepID=A0ABV8DLI7_9NOCA